MIAARARHSGVYLAIGGTCAVLANLVIILGDLLGMHYALGSLVSLFGVGAVGYIGHSRWTFRAPLSWPGYGRFVLGLASGTLLATAMLFVAVTLLRLPVAIASPAVTVLVTAWNYLSARWAILRAA